MKALKKINKYLIRYKWYLMLGLLTIILSNVFVIIPAQLVRHSIDSIISDTTITQLFKGTAIYEVARSSLFQTILIFGSLILLAAICRGLFLFLTRQTIIVMSRRIEFDLKNDIYAHYQTLPLSFYRSNNTGDLMNRISEDVSKVRMYVGPAIMYGMNLVVLFTLVIGYMLSVNSRLTLYVLLPLPLLSISIYYVSNKINRQSERIQSRLSSLSTFVQEAFSGIRVLKSFVREGESSEKFTEQSNDYRKQSLKLSLINSLFFPLIISMIGLSTILTIYVGGTEVIKGNITVGNIAEFIIYVNMLTWPVTSLGWITSLVQRAEASQKRINEFLDTKTEIVSTESLNTELNGDIEFDNVSLTYSDSGIEAVKNLSFKVEHGETLAIVGTTGSGKSTIANLITRMYDTSSGEIKIDGKNIKAYDLSSLRSQMGFVPQDVFLFSDSIKSNIKFGHSEATEEQMIQAAKEADVYENIKEFPEGFDTVIGERGITLSGGQKQRISIARALIKDPKILLLDDCLSAVDTKTEDAIINNLERIMENKTTIIITHRVSTVKLAKRILVMDDGEIVEEGSHESLMAKGGVYKNLYEMQQEHEEAA